MEVFIMKQKAFVSSTCIYPVGNRRLVYYFSDALGFLCPELELEDEVIPYKAQATIALAACFSKQIEKMVPNAFLSSEIQHMPTAFSEADYEGHVMLAEELDLFPFSFHVYGYMTGKLWEFYQQSCQFLDISLPAGIQRSERLLHPVVLCKEESGDFVSLAHSIYQQWALSARNYAVVTYCLCHQFTESTPMLLTDMDLQFGTNAQGIMSLSANSLLWENMTLVDASTYQVGKNTDDFLTYPLDEYIATALPLETSLALDEALDAVEDRFTRLYQTVQ